MRHADIIPTASTTERTDPLLPACTWLDTPNIDALEANAHNLFRLIDPLTPAEFLTVPTLANLPRHSTLSDKRILMVDDCAAAILRLAPELLATSLDTKFLLHRKSDYKELASIIISSNPDVLVMDWNLKGAIRVVDVIDKLRNCFHFKGDIIIHSAAAHELSSDPFYSTLQVDGFVEKQRGTDQSAVIKEIVKFVEMAQQRRLRPLATTY